MANVAALRALCRAERNVRKLAPLGPFATVRCAYHTTPEAARSGQASVCETQPMSEIASTANSFYISASLADPAINGRFRLLRSEIVS